MNAVLEVLQLLYSSSPYFSKILTQVYHTFSKGKFNQERTGVTGVKFSLHVRGAAGQIGRIYFVRKKKIDSVTIATE